MRRSLAIRGVRIVFVLSVVLLLLSSPCFADFRFVVMGDSRGSDDGIDTKVFRELLKQAGSESPEFILFAGDMTTGSKHRDIYRRRLLEWRAIVGESGIPVYIAIGNHEVKSELSEDILRSIFDMPRNGPVQFKGLAYSFDYHNAHFIALDTDGYKNFHRIDTEQLDWLKEDLENNKNKPIFVFGHEPAYPVYSHIKGSLDRYSSKRDELWDIFRKYGVTVYFCAHEHLYNRSKHEGVYQIITGGAGAHLHSSAGNGGFHHYVIVDVKDNGACKIIVKDIDGRIRDTLTINVGKKGSR